MDAFYRNTGPLTDLDEIIQSATAVVDGHEKSSAPVAADAQLRADPILTHRNFSASLTCPKKFYLQQNRHDLLPKLSIGEATLLDDTVGFNELARRWDRLQFGSRAVVIQEGNYEQAVQRTEDVITHYFNTTYASLREQAPTLTLHRPAFSAPFPVTGAAAGGLSEEGQRVLSSLRLRARPCVLRYRPKDNQWVIIEAMATVDPLGNAARAAQCLRRLHFSMLAFRYWVTQPHIPIAVRKRFLNINLDGINEENEKGHALTETASVAAPIDLKRSGILHIRNYMPGPATLMDCDPSRLVRFIQRLSLEELIEANNKYQKKGGGFGTGAFDLPPGVPLPAAVAALQDALRGANERSGKYMSTARSTRSLKRKDSLEQELFEHQQKLVEALVRHHTVPLMLAANDPSRVALWSCFSEDSPDGVVRSTYEQLQPAAPPPAAGKGKAKAKGRGKKAAAEAAPEAVSTHMPPYSQFLGPQCSRDTCPFFAEGKCPAAERSTTPSPRRTPPLTLPSSAVTRKAAWWGEGMRTVRDLLHQHERGGMKLTAPQLRYVNAVAEGKIAINPKEIDLFFSKVRYPCFVIDFEATSFALPPYQRETAYQSIPFQFSLDVFQHDILTETPAHYDFLHFGKGYNPNVDPRPACIDELMRIVAAERAKRRAAMEASGELALLQAERDAALAEEAEAGGKRKRKKKPAKPTKGTVLAEPVNFYDGCFIAHFASFEKGCLDKIGQLEDRYRETIKEFFFLDTLDLIKKGFLHPNAHGSNSLKKVLPAICPDFQYGVFGGEASDSSGEAAATVAEDLDEQKGENAMGLYRLWYHQESGGTMQDLQRSAPGGGPAPTVVAREAREKLWATLRIQLLEYCSLDTKALYEIMREIWKEKEAVKDVVPADKTGWILAKPTPREMSF
ncbi:hypothetical protein STCU_06540 [Strigomonas culicis]|uniref:DUF2779 domain-containing protein n=1 Tax=Strigomonas culicis TaxID=28005 RepID=S9U9U9_9TRYP|nr:hypothetical protein STCU_06540 [Strigomonas culicis]|eukprot:EPY25703.1 hypothetical protein STCU_06540 [Strigomonas culicis]